MCQGGDRWFVFISMIVYVVNVEVQVDVGLFSPSLQHGVKHGPDLSKGGTISWIFIPALQHYLIPKKRYKYDKHIAKIYILHLTLVYKEQISVIIIITLRVHNYLVSQVDSLSLAWVEGPHS